MISKPFPAHSFYHTCQYAAKKKGAEILLVEGVRSHDPTLMSEDFLNQQQMRPSKTKACFHSTLSFYPGENPSDELLKEIAGKYLQQLGIVNTQFAIIKHTDKAHLHIHIIANMVNNEGEAITDSWIGLRGKKIAQQLTQEYNLIPAIEKNLRLTHLESMRQSDAEKYKIYQAIIENLPHCRTLEELEKKLLQLGIETVYKYKRQTQEMQGISFKVGNVCFKGSQVDRKFSLSGLTKIIAEQQMQEKGQRSKFQPSRQKTDFPGHFTKERKIAKKDFSQSKPSENTEPAQTNEILASGLEKIVEILMTPEETYGQGSGGGPIEDWIRKKKKKRKRRSP
jgi:hypothetical protein